MVLANPGNIQPVKIEDEMRSAYLDYAMSVIVSRALPDVRDGLKPVHRRILYAMREMGLRPTAASKKSAAVVGEVLGKYHPHGDVPVYDTLVRMAQSFSMRYPLVQGQGNFGSVDDDPPAAMRYTEVRLAAIAEEMLADIESNTVDFVSNYDGSHQEPTVLPARLPNLLLNGSSGIAVGMATNIPPHNLREVCNAIVRLIDHPDASVEDLLKFVHGPDFPTAGIIMGREGMKDAYQTGRGRIVVRARATVEDMERGGNRQRIVVTELPYQVNKAALVEKIANLAKEKKLDGISDVRDESDREGLRMVVELARGAPAEQVLNNLYKHTAMQSAFSVHMLALVDGQPRVLHLRAVLGHYLDFRRTVVRRRAEFDLGKARDRAHVLEGLRVALSNLDEVVALIRNSKDVETARRGLMRQFGLSEVQTQAILDMPLRRLAALEQERIENEYQEMQKRIVELEALLSDPAKVSAVVRSETLEMRKEFGNNRRTEVWDAEVWDFTQEELTPHADETITLSDRGYIKRLPIEAYRLQHRGGKGVRGQETREGDAIQQLVVADTHDWLLFFTNRGRVYRERMFKMRQDASRQTRGTPIQQLININTASDERVNALVAISNLNLDKYIVMITRLGEVKRMHLGQFANIRTNGLAAMDLEPGDHMLVARLAEKGMSVIMITRKGKGVHFALEEIPLRLGRAAGGVRGIRLTEDDEVIAMDVAPPKASLLLLTERGYGKRTAVKEFRMTGRNVQGVIALRVTEKTGPMAAAVVTGPDVEEVMVGSAKAMVFRTSISEIQTIGRIAQGVKVMTRLADGDRVMSVSAFKEGAWQDAAPVAGLFASRQNGHAAAPPPKQLAMGDVADSADAGAPGEEDEGPASEEE